MAGLAVTTEPLLVYIIVLVAYVAGALRIGENRGQVALLAGGDCMQPNQRKARQVMIKPQLVRPAAIVMTMTALLTQFAGMHVIRPVTVLAVRPGFFLAQLAAMAGTAD